MNRYKAPADSGEPRRRPIGRWIVLTMFLALCLYFLRTCVAPLGILEVNSACEREGGVRIAKSVDVPGYWHTGAFGEGLERRDCDLCAEQVGRGDFEYVDYERRGPTKNGPAGFVRYQLLAVGDRNCMLKMGTYKVPPGMCI